MNANFRKGENGNILKQGTDLVVNVDGGAVWVTGRLVKHTRFGDLVIQIEQSKSKDNPMTEVLNFEMVLREEEKVVPYKVGKYQITTTAYFKGVGERRWIDDFEIIPA